MKNIILIKLVLLLVIGQSVCNAQDLSTFKGRCEWINQTLIGQRYRESRLPEINLYPDSLAIQQKIRDVVCSLDNQAVPIGVYALGLHWDHFPDSLKTSMKECIKSWREVDGHGTENHALMQNSAGYLFAQWFPGESGWLTNKGSLVTSEVLKASLKEKMISVFSSLYDKGYCENLSTTYDMLHIFPILAIYEFAVDEELVNAAEAALLFHFTNLALNSFHGMTISPFNRSNIIQSNIPQLGVQGNIQFMRWLYWPESSNYFANAISWLSHPHNWTVMYNASINWQPPKIIGRIAKGEGVPYSSHGISAGFGYWGTGWYPENLRTIYRTEDFAIGTGHLNYKPTEFYTDYKNFAILYKSTDAFNYLECSQNYWNSDLVEDYAWKKCANSLFQEIAQHENTVISLFNIPKTDPWEGVGYWNDKRDAHSQNLIQRFDIKYPKAIDEKVESDGWIFLREGDVYIGIKTMNPHTIDTNTGGDLFGFNMIRCVGAKNAVIFEVGTKKEHSGFSSFQSKLKANKLSFDETDLSVDYTNSSGDVLKATWVQPEYSKKGKDDRVLVRPEISINNIVDPIYTNIDWPVLESPYVSLKNRVLSVKYGGDSLIVDWGSQRPVITSNTNFDCNGDLNGTATIDSCGVCSGGKTEIIPNSCLTKVEVIEENNFILYPNPAEGTIYIEFDYLNHERVSIEMFNLNGRKIPITLSSERNGKYSFSTNNITDGFYIVKIMDSNKTVLKKKIVVQH